MDDHNQNHDNAEMMLSAIFGNQPISNTIEQTACRVFPPPDRTFSAVS